MLHTWRFVALTLAATPATALAQDLQYTFTGTITQDQPGSAIWGTVQVGDPYSVTFGVNDVPPTASGGDGDYYGTNPVSFSVTVGGLSSSVLTGGQVIVRDDATSGPPGCEDGWQWFAEDNATEYDQTSIVLQDLRFDGTCPAIVPGLGLPTAVDPSVFPTAFFRLRTLELTELLGTVDGVTIVTNNDCGNAIALPSGFADTPYDATGATTDGADATGFCDYGAFGDEQNHNDVWFTYTPAVGGCTYISTLGLTSVNTRITVYRGDSCPDSPMDIVACVDDEVLPATAPFEAGLDVNLATGQAYTIRVGTISPTEAAGPGTLRIAAGPQADANSGGQNPGAPGCVPPGNDSCMGAEMIAGAGPFFFDCNGATTDGLADQLCACGPFGSDVEAQIGQDVWFLWIAPTSELYTVSTVGLAGGADTKIGVYTGCGQSPIACNDDADPSTTSESEVRFRATAGTPYRFRIGTRLSAPLGVSGMFSVTAGATLPAVLQTASLGGSDYAYLEPAAWTDAQLAAEELGGNLATVDSQAEHDFLATVFVHGWIGLNDRQVEGTFEWVDGSPVVYTNWNASEPSESPTIEGEDFVHLALFYPGSEWNDRAGCTRFPGIVELPGGLAEACRGDGGDQAGCTDCPCANNAPVGSSGGCTNSNGTSARLVGSGSGDLLAGDLRFEMEGAVPSSFAVLVSGAAVAPTNPTNPCTGLDTGVQSALLDGLRCAVQQTQRHGGRPVAIDGTVGMGLTNGWGPPNGPPGGIGNAAGFAPGQTRHFQVFYRELPGTACGTEQNTTQVVSLTFSG